MSQLDMFAKADEQSSSSSWARFSPDRRFRYELGRRWGAGALLPWIMLNPSQAGAEDDDPTVRVVCGFARRWGFAGVQIGNVYSLIATDPKQLDTVEDPIGPESDWWIHELIWGNRGAGIILCGWGDRGAGRRANSILRAIDDAAMEPRCLGLTKAGNPVHPLRKPADLQPIAWDWKAA